MHHIAKQLYKPHLDFFFLRKIQDKFQSNNWIKKGTKNLQHKLHEYTHVAIQHEVVQIQNTMHRIWIQHDH